jgi:hypothetical protein
VPEDKDLIAYCGLYCGDCFAHQGAVAELSRDLIKELRKNPFGKLAESFLDVPLFAVFKGYQQCYGVLGALVRLRCRNTCKGGGCPPFCKMRKCYQKKGIEGCWECVDFETCDELDFLKAGHRDAQLKNLRKLQKAGVDSYLKGKKYWYSDSSEGGNA